MLKINVHADLKMSFCGFLFVALSKILWRGKQNKNLLIHHIKTPAAFQNLI